MPLLLSRTGSIGAVRDLYLVVFVVLNLKWPTTLPHKSLYWQHLVPPFLIHIVFGELGLSVDYSLR